ncbi:hypothetical protein E4T56_gene17714 [Termitomyces sp. T112]|nr:hypothetical protein E4T56_gene17714 [Termitomyces sp. T112]
MLNDKSCKLGTSVEPRKIQKAQVIIRRTTTAHKSRAHLSSEIEAAAQCPQAAEETTDAPAARTPEPVADELTRIRALLVPPPIPGVEDWGIPRASSEPPDAAIATKLAQFHRLKSDPGSPKHFNDSLMSNRSFRNPHLFAKLVEFVDVDERTTNFPQEVWRVDVGTFEREWFADKIAEYQREHSELGAGKKTSVGFVPAGRKSRFQPYPSRR